MRMIVQFFTSDLSLFPEEIQLSSFDGIQIYGHLSLPTSKGPFPAIIALTGGFGGAKNIKGNYVKIEEHFRLVPQGFAVFTVDHRGSPGHGDSFFNKQDLGGDDLKDVITATRYLMTRKEIDSERIGILGGSRGAYLAALAIQKADLYKAAVLMMGFYDLSRFMLHEQKTHGSYSPLVKYTKMSWKELWSLPVEERSPINFINEVNCPILLIHGEFDDVVPLEQSQFMYNKLLSAGKQSQLIIIPNLKHEYSKRTPEWEIIWKASIAFLTEKSK